MKTLVQRVKSRLIHSDGRSSKVVANILASFVIKGWSGVVQLLLVPVTLACLNNYEYGIWMTISTVLLWIDSFDVGLGNGLRNKIAEFVAKEDYESAQEAVSTTFFALVGIMIPISILLVAIIGSVDMYKLLNVDVLRVPNLQLVMLLSVLMVCCTFVFKFVGNVYLGLQLPAVNNMIIVLGQTVALLGVALISYLCPNSSLLIVATTYTGSSLFVYILSFPITFYWKYPKLCPKVNMCRKDMLASLFSLGFKFFVLQIFGIILFSTSNVIISRMLSPEMVTPYQISYRYLGIMLMLFGIVMAPLWSATTDAYYKKDMQWINRTSKRALKVFWGAALGLTIMVAISGYVYSIWTLGKVEISMSLTISIAIYVLVVMYSLLYAHFLFGMGTIRLQMYVTIAEALLFVPLAMIGVKSIGLEGLVWALVAVNLLCAISNRIQFKKIISGKAKGIWLH